MIKIDTEGILYCGNDDGICLVCENWKDTSLRCSDCPMPTVIARYVSDKITQDHATY